MKRSALGLILAGLRDLRVHSATLARAAEIEWQTNERGRDAAAHFEPEARRAVVESVARIAAGRRAARRDAVASEIEAFRDRLDGLVERVKTELTLAAEAVRASETYELPANDLFQAPAPQEEVA